MVLDTQRIYVIGTWNFQHTIETLSAALLIMSSVCSIVYVSYFGDVAKSVGISEDTVRSTFFFNSILCAGLAVARASFFYVFNVGTPQWIYFIFLFVSVLVELCIIGKKFDPE